MLPRAVAPHNPFYFKAGAYREQIEFSGREGFLGWHAARKEREREKEGES